MCERSLLNTTVRALVASRCSLIYGVVATSQDNADAIVDLLSTSEALRLFTRSVVRKSKPSEICKRQVALTSPVPSLPRHAIYLPEMEVCADAMRRKFDRLRCFLKGMRNFPNQTIIELKICLILGVLVLYVE